MTTFRPAPRGAYTLVELLMASVASTALIGGLASALFVSSRALDPGNGAAARRTAADRAAAALLSDTQHALRYSERTATALTFTVPDRTGDDQPETLRYAWDGVSGSPLTRSVNGGLAVAVANNVRSLAFVTDELVVAADDVTIPKNVPWPIVQDTQSVANNNAASTASVIRPTGTASGDLLLAAIAVNGNRTASLVAPTGFTVLGLHEMAGTVTLAVAWKVATASEPPTYTFSWSGSDRAIAWVIRVTNQNSSPITAFQVGSGTSTIGNCPGVATTLNQSLVLRFGAIDGDSVTPGTTGLARHTDLLMSTASTHVSGGCGWEVQRRAGNCGAASFAITTTDQYRTMTVIVAPRVN